MKQKIITVVVIIIAIALAVIGWFMLPDMVVMQIGSNGRATNTMPKPLGIAIPFLISVIGAVLYGTSKEQKGKKLLIAIIGIIAFVLVFVFNL